MLRDTATSIRRLPHSHRLLNNHQPILVSVLFGLLHKFPHHALHCHHDCRKPLDDIGDRRCSAKATKQGWQSRRTLLVWIDIALSAVIFRSDVS